MLQMSVCHAVYSSGVKAVWGLLKEIEQQCGPGRIKVLDIGGGLTVDYSSDDAPQVGSHISITVPCCVAFGTDGRKIAVSCGTHAHAMSAWSQKMWPE